MTLSTKLLWASRSKPWSKRKIEGLGKGRKPEAEANMRRCAALMWLGLVWWAGPASASGAPKVYSLTVSQQAEVGPPLTKQEVESILQDASKIVGGCNVRFTLNGEIGTF